MGRHEPSLWLSSQLNALLRDAMQRNFGRCSPTDTWAPSVNVYQLRGRLEVCVDLAGVQRESMDVRVEPGRLIIRGVRQAPEPSDREGGPMRIVGMEIDYGPFHREITLPEQVRLEHVQSSYADGLLWITLPMKTND
ncbi:MAG: Hsp20/alpha crystallin family protein [Phycisphaeraceae bacterium]